MTDSAIADRARGSLVGLVLGDCAGSPFEGQPIVWPDEVDVVVSGRGSLRYTDDTAMALDLGEWLVAHGPDGDLDALAGRFAATFRAEPWRGYGAGAQSLLSAVAAGGDWRVLAPAMFDGAGSWGNGAAMRVAPAGALHPGRPDDAARTARKTASVTHAHPLGIEGAVAMAAAVADLVSGATAPSAVATARAAIEAPELRLALERVSAGEGESPAVITQQFGNGVAALEAVPAAFAAFLLSPDDPWGAISAAVCVGGDTDTIAAMAGALAGAHCGLDALPARLVGRAEGAEAAADLADRLLALR